LKVPDGFERIGKIDAILVVATQAQKRHRKKLGALQNVRSMELS
jgi:hypothetical protein